MKNRVVPLIGGTTSVTDVTLHEIKQGDPTTLTCNTVQTSGLPADIIDSQILIGKLS